MEMHPLRLNAPRISMRNSLLSLFELTEKLSFFSPEPNNIFAPSRKPHNEHHLKRAVPQVVSLYVFFFCGDTFPVFEYLITP